MNYTKNYNHLTYDERAFIEIQIKSGYSIRSIARQLNRSPSTVSANAYLMLSALLFYIDMNR